MTNREVLAKFIKQVFNIEIKDDFVIKCNDIYCLGIGKCKECPGNYQDSSFWDREFIGNETITFKQYITNFEGNVKYIDGPRLDTETEEVVAFTSGEISW